MMVKHSSHNVPHPLPLIEEKAKNRLTEDGYISFKIILKEWEKVKEQDKKVISKLLVLQSHPLADVMDATHELLEESKDVFVFLNEHPEYEREEVNQDSLLEDLEKLLEDDE